MSPVILSQFDVLRRIIERAQKETWKLDAPLWRSRYTDIFQHLSNELEITRKAYVSNSTGN
jgi:hypothetical protein